MNFNNISNEDKEKIQIKLMENIAKIGSVNAFLTLIEEIRGSDTHPLLSGTKKFNASSGFIKWNKTIFKDKLILLSQIYNKKEGGLLPEENEKHYKKYLNLLKTLHPIVFSIRPKLRDDGDGFECKIFDDIDGKPHSINYMFEILFFSKMGDIKRLISKK